MLTNYKTIRSSIKRLRELEEQERDGTFAKLTKKEALMLLVMGAIVTRVVNLYLQGNIFISNHQYQYFRVYHI